ncbi:hypothetical protein [Jannaschia sp. LMIT008]|uniref:hypothetical protein n=1 Tax=Jannaschia maritima TaxID=3032585 RepID=UPI002811F0B4|nr:hypothetical protein [Jannaschia sp. LMIT008]
MNAEDLDRAHWGTATFVFSQDLADGLVRLALPDHDPDILRSASRDAILRNRDVVAAGHPPLHLRRAIADALDRAGHDDRSVDARTSFVAWVDDAFATPARPTNGRSWPLAPLGDPALLAEADIAIRDGRPDAASYAALLHGAIDADASDALMDAVFDVDAAIDEARFSDWDRAILARNADIHAAQSPLAPLIHTIHQGLMAAAARRVVAGMPTACADRLRRACGGIVRA